MFLLKNIFDNINLAVACPFVASRATSRPRTPFTQIIAPDKVRFAKLISDESILNLNFNLIFK
ncbi:hypothetical protein Cjcuy013_08750 [Campylobacter jejuni]|nr:hypothetical protein [Campylobacter jejuni]MBC5861720.1 hypothetical protein [Campylobacter jejuni]